MHKLSGIVGGKKQHTQMYLCSTGTPPVIVNLEKRDAQRMKRQKDNNQEEQQRNQISSFIFLGSRVFFCEGGGGERDRRNRLNELTFIQNCTLVMHVFRSTQPAKDLHSLNSASCIKDVENKITSS